LAVLFGVLSFTALLQLVESYLCGAGGLAAASVVAPACEAPVTCVWPRSLADPGYERSRPRAAEATALPELARQLP